MSRTAPAPVLDKGTLYVAYDRFVCGNVRCCGSTALYTGVTTGGAPVTPVTAADRREWASYGETSMTCECGAVTVPVG